MGMNFSESTGLLYAYSLEMTAKDVTNLMAASEFIPPGSNVSITYLSNEDMDARIAAATMIRSLGFVPIPHVAARRQRSEKELADFLARLSAEAAVDSVLVIAGDLNRAEGPYEDSLALIRSGLLQANGIRRVGIGGYPEGHPDISDAELWQSMKDKAASLGDAGLECEVITQFGFDPNPILVWLARLRHEGVAAPVRIGMPGPARISTLLRFAARCGVAASAKVMSKYGVSMTQLIGSAGPDRLIESLQRALLPDVHGEVHIHFYPFGNLLSTTKWANAFISSNNNKPNETHD